MNSDILMPDRVRSVYDKAFFMREELVRLAKKYSDDAFDDYIAFIGGGLLAKDYGLMLSVNVLVVVIALCKACFDEAHRSDDLTTKK